MKFLFACVQYLLPQHLLSRVIGVLANATFVPLKNSFITLFIKVFKVNMAEAVNEDPTSYASFNEFFVRTLKPGARPLSSDVDSIVCPADGTLSQIGDIENGQLFQAKGKWFDLNTLLGGDEFISQHFMGGKFATVYLSPRDYHRVHMPFDGQLQTMIHIPGKLFSVNQATTEYVSDLFARNERVVTFFDTNAGPMAVVLVGAMIVASIETTWQGQITPYKREIRTTNYPGTHQEVSIAKGDEMGRFKLGSTAIVLFGPDMVEWEENSKSGEKVRMGECLGRLING